MTKFVVIIIVQTIFIILTLFSMIIREAKRSNAYDTLLEKSGFENGALSQLLENQRDVTHDEIKNLKMQNAKLKDGMKR